VNHIPVDAGDGINISLSADSIDTTYFYRLLTPSIPYFPVGIDDNAKQATITAFSSIKADSLKVWEQVKAESITGLMLQYMPSLATPEKWYDKSNREGWSSSSFQITETSSEPPTSPSTQLWKLKLNDAVMLQALQLPAEEQPHAELNIASRVMELKETGVARPLAAVVRDHRSSATAASIARPLVAEVRDHRSSATEVGVVSPSSSSALSNSFALHSTFIQQSKALSVSKRLLVNQYLINNAITEPARTSSLSISFDYCLVKIRRPWYVDAFINDRSWYVPNVSKGQVTSSGPINMSSMPIGFVAIRNMNIESNNWAPEDVTNASVATQFGPFKVAGSIVNNKLSMPGLQIIGWLLQKMPELPPNDPPK
jgi:hypothetical protein